MRDLMDEELEEFSLEDILAECREEEEALIAEAEEEAPVIDLDIFDEIKAENQDPKVICQRRQNSVMLLAQ